MLFNYRAIDNQGLEKNGSIDAVNIDIAIASLQRRGLIISYINSSESDISLLSKKVTWFERISTRDIVIISEQLSTLFEAQVSALRIFRLLSVESDKPIIRMKMSDIADDLQAGSSISKALAKHPDAFSPFYVNMVRAGEESGKLNQIFTYLAEYLDRTYEVNSKVRNAFIYPIFVVVTFIAVMILMLTQVIPKVSVILKEAGQDIPWPTKVIIGLSDFFLNNGIFVLVVCIIGVFVFLRWKKTEEGKFQFDSFKIKIPLLGTLYTKLYLSRIADNMSTMLSSGIAISKTIEITATVVGNALYEKILHEAGVAITGGSPISAAFGKYPEMPGIMTQMIKVGEETGELGNILKTLSHFYAREVTTTVDTLIGLIEPAMIVGLGIGVAILLAAVILPIYSFSGAL